MNLPPFVEVWVNQKRRRFYLFKRERILFIDGNFVIKDDVKMDVPSLFFECTGSSVNVKVGRVDKEDLFIAGAPRKLIDIEDPTFFNFMNHDFFVDNVGDLESEFSTTGLLFKSTSSGLTYARSDKTIFIIGDTGTGKEILAKNIHYNSRRRHYPFIVVNCSSFDAETAERALFGNVKGAFTHAMESTKGAFMGVGKGTLVLDDIGSLSLNVQPMLLRALELREIRPVGSDKVKYHNARVIVTSSISPKELLYKGLIRKDLYYRIEECVVCIPRLMGRSEDIEALARFFVGSGFKITPWVIQKLKNYKWPGNIRELKNVINRARVLAREGIIDEKHILLKNYEDSMTLDIGEPEKIKALAEEERDLISRTLEENHWNIAKSSMDLGIYRATLLTKIKEYKLICKY